MYLLAAPAQTEVAADDAFPTCLELASSAVEAVVALTREVELVVNALSSPRTRLIPTPVVCK